MFSLLLISALPSRLSRCQKILLDDVPERTAVRVTQLAEQLVEVPTPVSCSREVRISERIVEQTVFLLVTKAFLGGLWSRPFSLLVANAFLRGLWSRPFSLLVTNAFLRVLRSSSWTFQFMVVVASSRGGPHDSVPAVPGQSSTSFGGGLQDFLPEQVSTAFSGGEHAHVAPRRFTPRWRTCWRPSRSSSRRFTGRIWHMPAARLNGYIESDSAKAAYAFVGDVPFFLEGSCRLGDHVTFAVGRGADGLEAFDLKVGGKGVRGLAPLTPSPVPFSAEIGRARRCFRQCSWLVAGILQFSLCSLLVVDWPSCSVWTERTFMQWAGFTDDDAPRTMFPFIIVRPKDAPHHGRYAPDGQLHRRIGLSGR